MRGGLRILVVVPARGGSQGVLRKNLRPVAGVPIVARVGHLVQTLDWVDRAVVSTDDAEIADVARAGQLGAGRGSSSCCGAAGGRRYGAASTGWDKAGMGRGW